MIDLSKVSTSELVAEITRRQKPFKNPLDGGIIKVVEKPIFPENQIIRKGLDYEELMGAYKQCQNCCHSRGEITNVFMVRYVDCYVEGKRSVKSLKKQEHCAAQIKIQ